MRVIAGLYKGRNLRTVRDLSVRPATDRVRQTLFDMLTHRIVFEGATVLDLFAGSGSLGIEALSRGAACVDFVESNREAAAFIEMNLETIGCSDAGTVLEVDAMSYITSRRKRYDIVFADPPYIFEQLREIPSMVFGNDLVTGDGYLIIEHSREHVFEDCQHYLIGPVKKFGRTHVTFFRHPERNRES